MPRKTELSEEDKKLRERLGAAVRRLTSAHGMKPQDAARVGGVSLAHQYRIESGETTPDALYLFKVATQLGVSIDSFFVGDSVPPTGQGAAGISQSQSGSSGMQQVFSAPVHAPVAGRDVLIGSTKGRRR